MTFDRWLMIGLILSTLIGPILPSLFQYRVGQPKPTQEPRSPVVRRGWEKRHYWQFAVTIAGIAFDSYMLVRSLHMSGPVTRESVFLISTAVAGILYYLLSINQMLIYHGMTRMLDLIGPTPRDMETLALMGRASDQVGSILGITQNLQERVAALELIEPHQFLSDRDPPSQPR